MKKAILEKGHLKRITLEIAEKMLEASARYARDVAGWPCSIAIVDATGAVIAVHRMDDAPPATVDIAIGKAWTAVGMQAPTLINARMLDQRLLSTYPLGGGALGLLNVHPGRFVAIHGGIPIRETSTALGMKVIGGIGASGCPQATDDNAVSQAGYVAIYD